MSSPPALKVITTWGDLLEETSGLRDFYKQALAAAEDLVVSATLRDEQLLRAVLETHRKLKSHRAFRVSNNLFKGNGDEVGYVH